MPRNDRDKLLAALDICGTATQRPLAVVFFTRVIKIGRAIWSLERYKVSISVTLPRDAKETGLDRGAQCIL